MSTFGPAYSETIDGERIRKQHEVIRDLCLDGRWRTLGEISAATGYPPASVSAQLRHLRKGQFGSYRVEKQRTELHPGLWLYRVLEPLPASPPVQMALGVA